MLSLHPTLFSCSVPSFKPSHRKGQFPGLYKKPLPSFPDHLSISFGDFIFLGQSLTGVLSLQPYCRCSVLLFQVPNLQHQATSLHLHSPCPCESSLVNPASPYFQPFCLQHTVTNTSVHILLGFRKGMDEGWPSAPAPASSHLTNRTCCHTPPLLRSVLPGPWTP